MLQKALFILVGLVSIQGLARGGSQPQEPLAVSAKYPGSLSKDFPDLTHDLLEFHKNLTEIESISDNEEKAGNWLVHNLESQGYQVERQYMPDDKTRFNVLAWPGSTRETKVLLSSHYDTVPPFLPYKVQEFDHNTTISGRGSVDDKASLAAQLLAVNTLLSQGHISPDDVSFLFVVGEETGGDGMRHANNLRLKPNTIIFGEPTEGRLVSGHKGNMAFKIHAKGKAAHSGYPWLGRSANEVLVTILAFFMQRANELPKSEKYGNTTMNIGIIEGGVANNVVPETALSAVSLRLAAGTPGDVRITLQKWLEEAVQDFLHDGLHTDDIAQLEYRSAGYSPVDLDHDVPGFDVLTVNYGTDVPNFTKTVKGQKRYLYGPGSIMVAHSKDEALTKKDLEDAVGAYQRLILHALGKDSSSDMHTVQ